MSHRAKRFLLALVGVAMLGPDFSLAQDAWAPCWGSACWSKTSPGRAV